MATLELRRVVKRYADTEVIHGVDLTAREGEFVVFVGPSGCGKSTLLRIISGLEDASAGEIRIDGQRVNEVGAAHRGCSMVFQSYALYPHMTVYQNLSFGLENIGTPKAEIAAKVNEAARMLRLEPYLQRRPTALSGGQRQRVAIGRAIVREPKIFLFDEPLSNLDAELRVQMRAEIAQLHDRLGTSMIYVTHDQVEAMTMADRIAVMSDGRLQQVGPPQAVYDRPHNLFVARFIGSPPMNTVPGTVVRTDAGTGVRFGGQTIDVEPISAEPLADATSVVIGVRPEHLVVDPDGRVKAEVRAVEWLGHERLVICDLAGHQITVRQSSGDAPVAAGDVLPLTADPGQVHLFDPDTTERLN